MSYRVTNTMMQSLLLNDMHNNLNKLLEYQQQLSTQRKYQSATDNPNAVTKGMGLETMMTETAQYKDNLEDAVSWLKFTDTALGDLTDRFHRVRELAIQAADGSKEGVDYDAIAVELEEIKKEMVNISNSTIAGEYLFAGLLTATTPFTFGPGGEVQYNGNDYAVKWEFSRREVGKVSITGSELFPKDETANRLLSIEVPLDFRWTGRSEKLEFKVGWQTVSVHIPERWKDETVNTSDDPNDYNRFREDGELEGWNLRDIADMINNSKDMGDVSKLLKAEVIVDSTSNTQRLVIKAHTGEPVRVTGWIETDDVAAAKGIKGAAYGPIGRTADADGMLSIKFTDGITYDIEVTKGESLNDIAKRIGDKTDGKIWSAYKSETDFAGTTHTKGDVDWIDIVARDPDASFSIEATGGAAALFSAQQSSKNSHKTTHGTQELESENFNDFASYAEGAISLEIDGKFYTTDVVPQAATLEDAKDALNAMLAAKAGENPALAELSADVVNGKLAVTSTDPNMVFSLTATGGLAPLFSDGAFVKSTSNPDAGGEYTLNTFPIPTNTDAAGVKHELELTGDGVIYLDFSEDVSDGRHQITVKAGDKLADIAAALAGIAGITEAKVVGDIDANGNPIERLEIKSTKKFSLSGFGSAVSAIGEYTAGSTAIENNDDHSHIGLATFLGFETTIKSTEISVDAKGWDTTQDGAALHIKFVGENHSGEVYISDDKDLTLNELAARINSVCGTWLQAVVETDQPDGADPFLDRLANYGENEEKATQRLVLRSISGEPYAIYDGPGKEVNGAPVAAGKYAQALGINTALMGGTANNTSITDKNGDPLVPDQKINVFHPEQATADSFFDEDMPAIVKVTVGEKEFECKICREKGCTTEGVATGIMLQVNEQYKEKYNGTGPLLAMDKNDITNHDDTMTAALYAVTGEPMRVVDLGYGDPRYSEFSGGLAMQTGFAAGVTNAVTTLKDTDTFDTGSIRISTPGRSVDVPILDGENLQQIAARIRDYAGEWIDVSFFDSTIGDTQDGGNVRLTLAAKDGSALSIIDIEPHDADVTNGFAHTIGLDTGLTGTVDLSGGTAGNFPTFTDEDTLTIEVDGFTHTIDLFDHELAVPAAYASSVEDMAALINARFQGQDIEASVYENGGAKYLTLTSPKGLAFKLSGTGQLPDALGFAGANATSRGFNAADAGSNPNIAGTHYNQTVTRRTGDNQKPTDFYGVLDNLIDCVRGGDVDGISDTMIAQLDNWMNSLLKCRSQVGALQSRYQTQVYRMQTNNTNYDDLYTKTVGVDLAETITNCQMASSVYEASLAAIARIMQPSLLNFLS